MKKTDHETEHERNWMTNEFSKLDLIWIGIQLTAAIGVALALGFLLNDMLAQI